MKISRKGVMVILLFLVGIPLIVDMLIAVSAPSSKSGFGMTSFLASSYVWMLPFYIGYLIIAFTILNFIKEQRNSQKRKDE